jgi:hypothetical protein
MGTDLARRRILVLSDNDGLSRAIELNLKHSHLEVIRLALSSPRLRKRPSAQGRGKGSAKRQRCPEKQRTGSQAEVGDFDLIVVAMSSPTSEPVVALARASLAGRIGRVPLLIISDRPFQSEPDDQITHLDFPFDIDRLHDKVKEILQRRSEPALMNVR